MQVNTDFYTADDTRLNGEWVAAKAINGTNYDLSKPLDKSITFCSSTENSPLLNVQYHACTTSNSYTRQTSVKGKHVIAHEIYDYITEIQKNSVNLGLAWTAQDSSYVLNSSYEIYKRRWANDRDIAVDFKIKPMMKYPYNCGALIANIQGFEIYTNPEDESGGQWIYSTNFSYDIDEYNDYRLNMGSNDNINHQTIGAYITKITLKWQRNSQIFNYPYFGYFNVDNQYMIQHLMRYHSNHTINEESSEHIDLMCYYYGDIIYGNFNSANGVSLFDGTNFIATENDFSAFNSSFIGAKIRYTLPEEELLPFPTYSRQYNSTTNTYYTNAGSWGYGIDVTQFSTDNLMKYVSTFGLPFMRDHSSSHTTAQFQQNGYIPITNNGLYNGKYMKYSDLMNKPENLRTPDEQQVYQKYSTGNGNLPFNYGSPNPNNPTPVNPNTDTKNIEIVTPNLTTTSVFNSTYAVTYTDLDALRSYLWNSDNNIFDRIVENTKLFNKPLDALISIMLFPFDVRRKSGAGATTQNIVFGRTALEGVQGVKLPQNANAIFDLGNATLYPQFQDFRDYEPYTTATLYIPYCAPVKISPSIFSDKTLRVKLVVDYITGDCVGVVYCEGIPVAFSNGKCGINIPVSAADFSRYDQKVVNDVLSIGKDITNGDIGTGTASTTLDFLQSFNRADILTKGSASSAVSTRLPQMCYLEIERVQTSAFENYGNTIGFACDIYTTIGNKSGLIVCDNPIINISCLDVEKQEIATMLQNGIYV